MSLETDLADYIVKLAPGLWIEQYRRDCLKLWKEKYGEITVRKVVEILRKASK